MNIVQCTCFYLYYTYMFTIRLCWKEANLLGDLTNGNDDIYLFFGISYVDVFMFFYVVIVSPCSRSHRKQLSALVVTISSSVLS